MIFHLMHSTRSHRSTLISKKNSFSNNIIFRTNPTTGVINLPKIGPNGLPIYPGQQQPKGPGGAQAYPALSQRVSFPFYNFFIEKAQMKHH